MSKLAMVFVCVVVLVGGCEAPSEDSGGAGWAPRDPSIFTPGGPSGVTVNPNPRRQSTSRRTGRITSPSAVVSRAPKFPTVANLIQCYRLVAAASYVYEERYDPNTGFVRNNYTNGYGLFLNEEKDTILSPALLKEGKRGFIVYTPKETRVYDFPKTPAFVEETVFRYDMRVRLPNGKLAPVLVRVLRVGEITLNFETGETYEQALERQKKTLESQRVGYGIWLKTEESSSDYPIVNGSKVLDSVAIVSLVSEMKVRLEDILSRSLAIGLDFRGGQDKLTEEQLEQLTNKEQFANRDVKLALQELANRDVRLALISQAMRACRMIADDILQRTVDQMQESLGYSE